MKDYMLSIPDEDLKRHPDYERIIQPGESLLLNNLDKEESCTGLGILGDDSRWYFCCPSEELQQATDYLLSEQSLTNTLIIQRHLLVNLPANLRDVAKKMHIHLSSKGVLEKRAQ